MVLSRVATGSGPASAISDSAAATATGEGMATGEGTAAGEPDMSGECIATANVGCGSVVCGNTANGTLISAGARHLASTTSHSK